MILYILMIIFATGMLWTLQRYKKKGDVWARPAAGIFGTLALIMAISTMFRGGSGPDPDDLHAWTQVQVEYLGQHLAAQHPDTRILLIHDMPNEYNRMDEQIAAFEQAIGGRADIVAKVIPPQESIDPAMAEFQDYIPMDMVPAHALDDLLANYPNCNLIVSMVGLPMDFRQMKIWSMDPKTRPKLALLNSPSFELKPAIERGAVVATVVPNPDIPFSLDAPPRDIETAFHERYFLVTPENIEEIAANHQDLFLEE